MRCCGSERWASRLANKRPFASWTQLQGLAEWIWWQLDDVDWCEAFSHHPRIGADPEKLAEKFTSTAEWSGSEQAGVGGGVVRGSSCTSLRIWRLFFRFLARARRGHAQPQGARVAKLSPADLQSLSEGE